MINETVNIGNMDVDLMTNSDNAPCVRITIDPTGDETEPCVRITIDPVYHSAYLTMRQVNDLVNTLSGFLDRMSSIEEETSESLLKNFLKANMEVCNVTSSDAPTWSYKMIDAAIASPNEDGYYWASMAGKCSTDLYPICYIKDDKDGWILPACCKSKIEWWYPKKLKTKFSEED